MDGYLGYDSSGLLQFHDNYASGTIASSLETEKQWFIVGSYFGQKRDRGLVFIAFCSS